MTGIVKNEKVVDTGMQGTCNIVCEFQGGIVLPLFKKNDCLSPDADGPAKVFLRKVQAGTVFPDSCLHYKSRFPIMSIGLIMAISIGLEMPYDSTTTLFEDNNPGESLKAQVYRPFYVIYI